MRRAVVHALRSGLRSTARGALHPSLRAKASLLTPTACRRSAVAVAASTTTTRRFLSSSSSASATPPDPLQSSSMYFRRSSLALVSALVGFGAYYTYNGNSPDGSQRPYSTTAVSTPSGTADAATPTRTVLVISADELHTGTFVGEGPIVKTTSDDGRRVIEMLTPEQATQKLRRNEKSFLVNRGQGVVRYDVNQLPSNDPIEDDHDEKIVQIPDRSTADGTSDWMFWGVFDGHSGWATSAKLRQALVSFVARELNETYKASNLSPSPEAVDAAIKKGFVKLDDEIVHQSVQKVLKANNKTAAAELLAPALSGSCALLSFYDSRTSLLRVACTGDSRAVLGRRAPSGKWTATPLSVDQTGGNPDEEARLRAQHPGEPYVVYRGRVLGGLEPTRAFGDASYKWTRETAEELRRHYFARHPNNYLKTPPYVTAEPVITTTKIEPEKGDFLVMATDGLWEMLTNEEVVGLVGKWLESQPVSAATSSTPSHFNAVWTRIFGSGDRGGLPVEAPPAAKNADGQKTPFRGVRQWSGEADGFVVQDRNAATHLVRNALGGKNQEQVSALLTLPAPISRRYRDDLTVQVIFFGTQPPVQVQQQLQLQDGDGKSGQVVINLDATAPGEPPKPKL